jgi:hypothetical protein
MAQPSNTYDSYDLVGVREDLSNVISRIDPTEVPFQSNIGKMSVSNTYFEWQTQALAAADADNAHIDGDDTANQAPTATVRVGGRTQIFKKSFGVSGTADAVNSAGRAKESAYQALLKGLELRRDIEARLVANKASVTGNSTSARQTAGIQAWLETNTSRGTSGADGGFSSGNVSAATDGTTRAFTETLLKTVNLSVYTAGGKASMLMMGPAQKTVFSGFAGLAQTRVNDPSGQTMIIGGADKYVSDFGTLTTTVNLFQDARSALLVDPSRAKVATLRPMKREKLAKTGDSEKYQIVCELGLMVENEAAHGIVADLT